jgi:hypothetical protein
MRMGICSHEPLGGAIHMQPPTLGWDVGKNVLEVPWRRYTGVATTRAGINL